MSHAYPTEAERLEARRRTYRESKARRAAQAKARKGATEDLVRSMICSGQGPAWRRNLMLDILERTRR